MSRKLALKKLKPSDLSFFKSYLTKHPQSKQKAINLDSSVVEGEFFPSLKAQLEPLDKKATHIDLNIAGPGLSESYSLARKIKIDAKNIRLNGEVIHGTDAEPARYDVLESGDFAMMEFVGTAMPIAVKVVLIAAGNADDATMHAALQSIVIDPNGSMAVIEEADIDRVIAAADPSFNHPIRGWLDQELLEELGSGDATAAERLNARRPGRGISPSDFKASRASAEQTGRLGEELMDQFLATTGLDGMSSYEWVSDVNAVSPYDFLLTFAFGGQRHADAKSTSGKFSNPVYLSMAEVRHAVVSGVPYDIYRLYDVKADSAKLRVAKDVGSRLSPVLQALDVIPAGVSVDSLSFDPGFFDFDAVEYQV